MWCKNAFKDLNHLVEKKNSSIRDEMGAGGGRGWSKRSINEIEILSALHYTNSRGIKLFASE